MIFQKMVLNEKKILLKVKMQNSMNMRKIIIHAGTQFPFFAFVCRKGQHCLLWYSVYGKKKWRKKMSIEKIISEISQQELQVVEKAMSETEKY